MSPVTAATISAVANAAINFKKIKDEIIAPIVEKLTKDQKSSAKISQALDAYIKRSHKKYRTLDTIVYPGKKMDLMQLYVPLKIESKETAKIYKLDNFDVSIFRDGVPKLIIDNAGMGKSTLVKYLFLSCLKSHNRIPFIVELRRLKGTTINEFIKVELTTSKFKPSSEDIVDLLSSGTFSLFFDGLDEVQNNDVANILNQIDQLINEDGVNDIIVTSRDSDFLFNLPNFDRYRIKPLTLSDAKTLIVKYGSSNKELVDGLIKAVESNKRNIDEFLKNPLMVSLLFKSFEYKHYIPFKKNIFYRQVFDALFESHDLSKGDGYRRDKKSKLDIDEFHKICRLIGFISYKSDKIEFSREELVSIISDCGKFASNLNIKSADIIDDLVKAVPIFIYEGGMFRWIHKSFQEYFAAQALYLDFRDGVEQVLTSIYNNTGPKHRNFIDLYFDIDEKNFAKYILAPFIKDYENKLRNSKEKLVSLGLYIEGLEKIVLLNEFCIANKTTEELKDPENPRYSQLRQNMKQKKGVVYAILDSKLETYAFVQLEQSDYILSVLYSKKVNFVNLVRESEEPSNEERVLIRQRVNELGPIGNFGKEIKFSLNNSELSAMYKILVRGSSYIVDLNEVDDYLKDTAYTENDVSLYTF